MKESADDIKEFRINRNKTFRCSKRRKVYQYSKKKYQQAKKAGLWKPALLFGILIVIFVSFRLLGITDYIFTAQDKVESLGIWAPVIFILIFIVLIVLVVPGSAITIACGLLFPLPLSLIVDSIASTIGATIAFLISRYVAREPLRRFLSRYPWFSKMEQISYHRGALLVVFIRITP
ncbi:MAG: VTT domain-containing protein, partial [Thermoplasmata archaeon]